MPSFNLNRTTAWPAWQNAKVRGTNIDILACGDGSDGPDHIYATDITDPNNPIQDAHNINHHLLANIANKNGLNAVRVFFPSLTLDTLTQDRMQRIFTECLRHGIGVILTVGYNPPDLWTNVSTSQKLIDFWLAVVAKWGTEQALIGIDFLNEPAYTRPSLLSPDPANNTRFATVAEWQADANALPQFTQRFIKAMRTASWNGPIIVKGPGDAVDFLTVLAKPDQSGVFLTDPLGTGTNARLVYSFHSYDPYTVASAAVNEEGNGVWTGMTYPGGSIRRRNPPSEFGKTDEVYGCLTEYWGTRAATANSVSTLMTFLNTAKTFKSKYNVPVYMGEFGVVQPRLQDVYPTLPKREKLVTRDATALGTNPELIQATISRVNADTDQLKYNTVWADFTDNTGKVTPSWKSHHWSQWITRLDVFTDASTGKKRVRAYFDNIDRQKFGRTYYFDPPTAFPDWSKTVPSPAPLPPGTTVAENKITEFRFETGFRVAMTSGDINTLPKPAASTGFDITKPMTWPSSWFKHKVLLKIAPPAGLEWLADAFDVEVELDKYWVEFDAPAGAVSVARQPLVTPTESAPTTGTMLDSLGLTERQYFPPVALASFQVCRTITRELIDQSRTTLTRHYLYMAQQWGLNWTHFAWNEPSVGFVGWNPSPAMSALLRDAAMGRAITAA
jgi:hypothetical protein